ncbi:MAG: hypothetical protein IKL22_12725 [Lachnospiraceae bacterium]|nr:hypothetical protein [Lachnospiraceae bacterium]
MKKRWKEFRGVLLLGMAIGWWGLWYPELEKVADTYAIVWEDGTVQMSSELLEYEFDETDKCEIRISSKFWKMLKEFWIEDNKQQ